jgi:hypothetical protein
MRLANFTVDQLKVLPLRAIVAFAARCARRVEPLAQLPEGDPRRETRREAFEAALRMAEAYASGTDVTPDESVVAAIDASRDAGGDSAGPTAWHAGPPVARTDRPPGDRATQTGKSARPLAYITADLAAMNAFTAAADAFLSVGYHNENFVAAALSDYA